MMIKAKYIYLQNKWQILLRNFYLKSVRKKILNNDLTFISNDCSGAYFYQLFGMSYSSPFIWSHIDENSFMTMCLHIDEYMNGIINISHDDKYPTLLLEPYKKKNIQTIKVEFIHSKNKKRTLSKFNERKQRMANKHNLLFIFDVWQYDSFDVDLFHECKEKYGNRLIVISHLKIPFLDKKDYIYINTGKNYFPGKIFTYHRFGKNYIDRRKVLSRIICFI